MPRRQLFAFVIVLGLVAGCASSRLNSPSSSASSSSSATGSTSGSASASDVSAGYACSTADVYGAVPGAPVRQIAILADTQATLTGTSTSVYGLNNGLQDGLLTVTRAGQPSLRLKITPAASTPTAELYLIGTDAIPTEESDRAGSLCLVRFTAGAAPVAVLALTTGGAHCCTVLRAVPLASDDGSGPRPIDRDFGNSATQLRSSPSGPIVVSADDAFSYTFSSFAASEPPVRIFEIAHGAYVDVTRAHPQLVNDDLARHWASYTDPHNAEPLGALAGWAGDKCLLDPARRAPDLWSFLDHENATGKLVAPRGWPSGDAFISSLRTLLVNNGYCVAPATTATSPTR